MSTTDRTIPAEERAALAAVRDAVRTVEDAPGPRTLHALDSAIADLTLTSLDDDAERTVRTALDRVSNAADSEVFGLLGTVDSAVTAVVRGPRPPLDVFTHPAPEAMVMLLNRLFIERNKLPQDSSFYRAWDRAVEEGFSTLRMLTSCLYGEVSRLTLERSMAPLSAAVRRAVAYRALYTVRLAMVKVARCHRLFVIGGRQPLPDSFRGAWTRVLGAEKYRFEVTPSDLVGGAPYGWVLVTRVSDGVRVHVLPLTGRCWTGQGNSRISRALYAI
ncbi:hypothetical protein ACFYZ9_33650 [Streptomyces sp. NPDC001691]|uniref:hypothetical protein n=1 Tax=Streptomyces sp. NPDC001691 TaxID=3364600 RepID=UPI0036767381